MIPDTMRMELIDSTVPLVFTIRMNKAHPKSKLYEECSQSEMSQMCKDMINLGKKKLIRLRSSLAMLMQ